MVAMNRIEREIYDAVRERPRTAEQLRTVIWGHLPDGGPESRHNIYVQIHHLNKRIAAIGEKVAIDRPGNRYRLRTALTRPAHKLFEDGLYSG